jgi:hypothetical protein
VEVVEVRMTLTHHLVEEPQTEEEERPVVLVVAEVMKSHPQHGQLLAKVILVEPVIMLMEVGVLVVWGYLV